MGVASKLELHTDFKKGSLLNTRSEMSSLLRGGDLPCHYSSSLLCSVLPVSLFIKTYQRLRSEPAGHASHLSTTRNIRKTPTTLGAATVSILLKTPLRDAGCSHCALTFYMRLISSRFPCERLLRRPAALVIKYRIHRTDFFFFFFRFVVAPGLPISPLLLFVVLRGTNKRASASCLLTFQFVRLPLVKPFFRHFKQDAHILRATTRSRY